MQRILDSGQKEKQTFGEPGENTSLSFHQPSVDAGFTEGRLFAFDPNNLPTAGSQQLGLARRTIKTINNHRSKGGRFYKKEDLIKIWGLPEAFYHRVEAYIVIEDARPSSSIKYPSTTNVPLKEKETFRWCRSTVLILRS